MAAKPRIHKCKTCKAPLQKDWDYCPKCGGKIREENIEIKIDKIKYLVERQKCGDIIYDNFKSVTEVSKYHAKKQEIIRKKTGDFVNINFGLLRIISLLCQKPDYINEFFKVGKLIGYFATINGLKVMGKTEYLGQYYKSDSFWNFVNDSKFQAAHMKEWYLMKEGVLEFVSADRDENIIRYNFKEGPMSILKFNKSLCFFEVATECGVAEALSNIYWTGRETKCQCKGDEHCEFEIIIEKQYREPNLEEFSKNELENLLNQCIDNIILKDKIVRRLTNNVHLMDDQVINYLLMSPSIGHHILSKFSGNFVGQKIMQKMQIIEQEKVIEFLTDLFENMKVGLLSIESRTTNKIELRMDESAYSSGVKNINMKLDIFIAGMIEGVLKQATNQPWQVEETKCIANGDTFCEFICKVI
jgi:predicted hydrocarbon binding protein